MITIIPFDNSSFFSVDVLMGGEYYTLVFGWNTIYTFWTMDIYDNKGNLLIAGLKVSPMQELLSMWVNRGLPKGEMYAVNIDGSFRNIEYTDFFTGKSMLIFVEAEANE